MLSQQNQRYFEGYMRENGKVGVRNEVWIVPTVGCVNSIARAIEATARANKPEGVDEVVAFTTSIRMFTDNRRPGEYKKDSC